MVKQIFIVRHTTRQDTVQSNWAETAEYGYNPPLADLGHTQALEAGRYIRSLMHQTPTRVMVHTSPFLRCVQTAAHIAEELIGCNPKIRMDAALGEWLTPDYFSASGPPPDDNHADLANQAVSALQRQSKLRLVENGWNISCLGDSGSMREFWSEMHLRFEHYLKRLNGFYSKHNRKIETLIIVTHGAGVSSLLTHFCGEPVLSEIRLGSISLVSRDEEADELASFSGPTPDSGSRSRAGSITNWAWLGPEQVEEKFSIGSWQLDLLNVAAGGAAANGAPGSDGLAAPGSDMSMKRRTSSPAMFMLNTTFLGSAPPSTRTSRASSLLRPSGPPPIVMEGVATTTDKTASEATAKQASSSTAAAASTSASAASPAAAARAKSSGGSQLTPSASVPAMLVVESGTSSRENEPEVSASPSTPPGSVSPEGSPTTSPQFSSGTWLLGSNRW
ncbi:hypothetical protein CJU89_5098 [Yarrowia sp. B02]|nr:hypothetical protein CJU89_5098 [Yarrowia sp. B02]